MFEIYYTSAPEGLKPNARGFCTVAATEGLPRALGERLEALSAYRHHFAAGGGARGQNPISFAHWLLAYGGNQYHVLSRICDSGIDYTRRTNAFAHHIALDHAEAAEETAGPAAALATAGILQNEWDQRVGALQRTRLPRLGSGGEPRVCTQWERMAGDAGWAGVVAESFTKNPPRPVCILFSPGQEMLLLMAEAIALLPAAMRWQVTFNTYFTSMPPSATCLWRCCLAGTPAGDAGVRYAASGWVLDLSGRGKLPGIVESPWVEYARTGFMPAGGVMASGTRPPERKVAEGAGAPAAADGPAPHGLPVVLQAPAEPAARGQTIGLAPEESASEEERVVVNRDGSRGRRLTPGLMVTAKEKAGTAQREIPAGSGRGLMAGVLVIVVAIVFFSIYLLIRALIPPPPPPPAAPDRPMPVVLGESSDGRPPAAAGSRSVQSNAAAAAPAAIKPLPSLATPSAAITEHSGGAAQQPMVVVPRDFWLKPVLKNPLQPPMSINDKVQKLRIDGQRISDLEQVGGVQLLFGPDEKSTVSYKDVELDGTFTQEPDGGPGRRDVNIFWKNPLDPGEPSEVASIRLQQAKAEVEVIWKARMLADVEHARAAVAAYWILQHAALVVADSPKGEPVRLHFEPVRMAKLSLAEAKMTLEPSIDLPAGARARVVEGLPAGWRADVVGEPEKDPPGVSQVLYIAEGGGDKSAGGDLRGWFTIRFKPGWGEVECTLARNREDNERKLTEAQQAVKDLDANMNQKISEAETNLQGAGAVVKAARINQLDAAMAEPKKQKADLQKTIDACMLVRSDFEQVKFLDVAVELPGGLPAVTLHFVNPPASSIKP